MTDDEFKREIMNGLQIIVNILESMEKRMKDIEFNTLKIKQKIEQ